MWCGNISLLPLLWNLSSCHLAGWLKKPFIFGSSTQPSSSVVITQYEKPCWGAPRTKQLHHWHCWISWGDEKDAVQRGAKPSMHVLSKSVLLALRRFLSTDGQKRRVKSESPSSKSKEPEIVNVFSGSVWRKTDVKLMGSRSSTPSKPSLACVKVLHLELRYEELQLEAANLELGAQQLAAHKAAVVVTCSH